jgi:hypothetical protein
MVTTLVSPKYTTDKLKSGKIEDRIDVFEDRIKGWFLDHATALTGSSNAQFAILQLSLSYFETYAIYKRGEDSEGQSKKFFVSAFLEVFPYSGPVGDPFPVPPDFREKLADDFYRAVRCGLFHSGMTGYKVLLGESSKAITVSVHKPTGTVEAIIIDPAKFVDEIRAHFDVYLSRLRDASKADLRANFTKAWELKNPTIALPIAPGGVP